MTPAGRPGLFSETDWEVTRQRAARLRTLMRQMHNRPSARWLADRLKAGGARTRSAALIGKYLHGTRMMPAEFLVDVASELNVPPAYLLSGEQQPPDLSKPSTAMSPAWREWFRSELAGQRLSDSRGFALIAYDERLQRLGIDPTLRAASVSLARTALDSADAAVDATKRGREQEGTRRDRHRAILRLLLRDIRKLKGKFVEKPASPLVGRVRSGSGRPPGAKERKP